MIRLVSTSASGRLDRRGQRHGSGVERAPDDLRALAALEPDGLEGVIVGKALYAGRLTVAEALAVLAAAAGWRA